MSWSKDDRHRLALVRELSECGALLGTSAAVTPAERKIVAAWVALCERIERATGDELGNLLAAQHSYDRYLPRTAAAAQRRRRRLASERNG